jgi:hypothetical protein
MESLIEQLLMGLHPPDHTLMQCGYQATMKDALVIGVGYQATGEENECEISTIYTRPKGGVNLITGERA